MQNHEQMTWKLSRASTGNPQSGNPKNTVALGICLPQWLFQFYYILGGPCLWFPLEPLQTGLAWWPTKRSLFGGVSNKNYLDFEGLLFVYNHVAVGLESASGKGLLYPLNPKAKNFWKRVPEPKAHNPKTLKPQNLKTPDAFKIDLGPDGAESSHVRRFGYVSKRIMYGHIGF